MQGTVLLKKSFFCIFIFSFLFGGFASAEMRDNKNAGLVLMDNSRNREIPVELYFPPDARRCSSIRPCPVVIFSAGYGINCKDYNFIFDEFNDLGYLVVSINHEIESDAKLDQRGDIRKQLKYM